MVKCQFDTIWLLLTVCELERSTMLLLLIGKPSISMGHGLTMANCECHKQAG